MTDQDLKNIVERFGVFFEQQGASPVAARIIGYLLFSNPPKKNFYEIVSFLGASKSSVSQAINILLDRDIISYSTLPGDRKRYFQVNVSNWVNIIKTRMRFFSQVLVFIEEAIEMHKKADQEDSFLEDLMEVESLYSAFADAFEKILLKWEKNKNKNYSLND